LAPKVYLYGFFTSTMMLQRLLSRKVGSTTYYKWAVVIPPEKIKEAGWKEGVQLDITVKDGKITLQTIGN